MDRQYKKAEDGRWVRWQKRRGQEQYKVYLSEGGRQGDVWQIPPINASAKERLGYETQKPLALLERVIKASSNEGDIVLDPFCGCGTTLVVAHQLGRKRIGIDVALKACNLMKDRLNTVGASNVRIIGAPKTIEELKQLSDWQFQNWVIERIGWHPSTKKSGDMGIAGYTFMDR